MNISKTLLAGVVALATVAAASAQNIVYITGSTAFRSATVNAIGSLYSGGSTASDNATFTSANAVTWSGGSVGGTACTIKVSWAGSASGIQTVGGLSGGGAPFSVRFLPNSATGTSNPDPRQSANPADPENPDIAMSDVFQGATPFNGTFNGTTYDSLNDQTVGVVSFVWAASSGFPLNGGTSPISNYSMTPQVAQDLFPNGKGPLSLITGSSGDDNNGIIATGRDPDSGTRLTSVSESGIGVNTTLTQWKPAGISGGVIGSLALYPATTINGVAIAAGNGGESSGSTLRGYLVNTVSTGAAHNVDAGFNSAFLITYLGVSDYNSVSGSGAVQLLYTGNQFSQNSIIEGKYTMWGYEHLDYRSSASGFPVTFGNGLATKIQGETSAQLSPNVSIGDMTKVQRFADGGTVFSLLH